MRQFPLKKYFTERNFWLLLKPGLGPWTRILNPDPDPDPGPRPWTRTLKKLDPEKHEKQLDIEK